MRKKFRLRAGVLGSSRPKLVFAAPGLLVPRIPSQLTPPSSAFCLRAGSARAGGSFVATFAPVDANGAPNRSALLSRHLHHRRKSTPATAPSSQLSPAASTGSRGATPPLRSKSLTLQAALLRFAAMGDRYSEKPMPGAASRSAKAPFLRL